MCLIVKDPKAKTAKEDITCYKVLNESNVYDNPIWMTPYICVHIENKYINGECILHDDREFDDEVIADIKTVGKGGFHCFKKMDDAINDAMSCYNSYVFECVIPTGTLYYDGDFFGWPAYVAKDLKFIKKLEKDGNEGNI